jgi:radical SAM superfamily enzyme YgiQ (UPF0313 family)
VDANRRAIEVLRRHGVDTYGSLIPNPDYTPDDWAHLQRFIDETGLYYLNVSPLTPLPGTAIWDEFRDRVVVSRKAHGLWDLSHAVLPTRMPLRDFYRALVGIYVKTCLSIPRANRLTLRTRPPVFSRAYLRLWGGAVRIYLQFMRAHRHHTPRALREAMNVGPSVPGLVRRQRSWQNVSASRGKLGRPLPVMATSVEDEADSLSAVGS